MWQMSFTQDVYSSLPPPEQSGWIKDDKKYSIDWEATEALEKIKGTIHFLTRYCSCKKGCRTNNWLQKKFSYCGPSCTCQGCINLPLPQSQQQNEPSSETIPGRKAAVRTMMTMMIM